MRCLLLVEMKRRFRDKIEKEFETEVRTMGSYLNPGSDLFEMALQSQIFVDKSGLIEKTNRCVRTLQRYLCVSRPRRFGKSMAADMLAAYYDRSTDTDALFRNLKIGRSETYKKHRN